jgi:hypothetical protein
MSRRYLIESSVVRPVLGFGSSAQAKEIRTATDGAELWSSTYLRMEFIRGVVCAMARMAAVVRNFDNCTQAFAYLSNDFSTRDVKVYAQVAGLLLDRSVPKTTAAWAETIASEALKILRRFDALLTRRIRNRSHCQIGGGKPEIDYNTLINDLNSYCRDFLVPVPDCEINAWLDLANSASDAPSLLKLLAEAKIASIDHMADMKMNKTHITCRECVRLSDAVIALEQPQSITLVYSDNSFNHLCPALNKPGLQIPSAVAAERAANSDVPPL